MTRKAKPVTLNIRMPIDLYEAIDVYAEHEDVTLSEALRRLAVRALDDFGMRRTITDADGTREDRSWTLPLNGRDQD